MGDQLVPGRGRDLDCRWSSSSTLLVPIALGASTAITVRTKEFVVYTLLLEAGLIGAFLALDLFLFFVFFEVILIPMYFIIGIWGGERRIYAAVKFFIYTAFGSALMMAAIIALAFNHASAVRGAVIRPPRPDEPRPGAECRDLALRGVRPRLRHQGAACSHSTPGSPMPMSKRPPQARSSWPGSC